ncbi:MAG: hypothetical protein CMK64_05030 [Pseudoalteromonas sp.]|nr:hypothetical protein [Pseudoalteromonas sp.]|tara:strand:- start:15705 stop:16220 length:516 start_codon:yes stop_codon:yes gene_type:complete
MINLELLKFEIPQNVLTSLQEVVMQRAFVDVIRPINEKVEAEALIKFKPQTEVRLDSPRSIDHVSRSITTFSDVYLADDETACKIYNFHLLRMHEEGFSVENGKCPFLCALAELCEKETRLINSLSPFTGIKAEDLTIVQNRKKYLELTLNYLLPMAVDKNLLSLDLKKPF